MDFCLVYQNYYNESIRNKQSKKVNGKRKEVNEKIKARFLKYCH